MNDKTFKLYASCVPVKGAQRSTICDIQRGQIKFIPNDLFTILTAHEGKSLSEIITAFGVENTMTIRAYFDYLIQYEFGFWSDHPELFPEMDKKWETPVIIENGIVDSNRKSQHDFQKIFKAYAELGCQHLQLRFFDPVSFSFLKELTDHLNGCRINSVELLLAYSPQMTPERMTALVDYNLRISKIWVHSAPEFKQTSTYPKDGMADVFYIPDVIDSHMHCGIIIPEYFRINQAHFLEAQEHNTCLNKKISIDVAGEIKNCPSMANSFGNIKKDQLSDVVRNEEFRKLWGISKDNVKVCQDCEFRYVCSDCRAYLPESDELAKPVKCSYDPYAAEWKDEKAYVTG